jgi:hypothetical protein
LKPCSYRHIPPTKQKEAGGGKRKTTAGAQSRNVFRQEQKSVISGRSRAIALRPHPAGAARPRVQLHFNRDQAQELAKPFAAALQLCYQ